MKKKIENNNIFIRLEEIKLLLDEDEGLLIDKISQVLEIDSGEIINFVIVKKAIDSRNKNRIIFVYSLDVKLKNHQNLIKKIKLPSKDFYEKIIKYKIREQEAYIYKIEKKSAQVKNRPLIVGSGPSGLFCALVLAKAGLKPTIIERGADVKSRIRDVEKFFKTGDLNLNSNIQFGEGGAGTFSDGKLYTSINNPRTKFIFDELIKAGAPREIAWSAHPHIGTDKLREVVKNIRKKIENLGGEIRFNSCLTDIDVQNGKIASALINQNEWINEDCVVIAIGHSARDTYEMLYQKGLIMSPKTFSIGIRIEHKAEMINKAQYGKFFNHPKLPAARYKLVAHLSNNRSVYTFCMCPGGYVIAAASEKDKLVVNGMSKYAQDNENSNCALLVNIFPSDFMVGNHLAGINFQREWEEKAFLLGGGKYRAPIQLLGDFLKSKKSKKIESIAPSYRPGVTLTDLNECLPVFVTESIREALPILDKKIRGFAHPDAVLTGIESRSSSPVRIFRDNNFESSIKGIFPAGEGAGYSGGITSSAIDGIMIAESILKKY
ncbi:hypothetical protein A2331_03090 [Candidatus Falkowbacteria bacterium RIFOXYB2_FULL_34_18]|uniref:FAD-dependent protein C-terminal domain-containing protein n=1 Tax=Candidatus Falkowbacteria bacterium RIFOXYD2_FULL_34_120 TaxID=1798007 RepID=A0A1F5TPA5_9BACT|nr:MAG: hypothetical protein A2331_03090 [Candidatus Falkowbacteria bacterium RIFOXYB2_FULL_34_18]OGF29003.1 MAG: hypothetical protein A2500_00445 [Candidatus Falkowbacteria bacterium RIFOXYC12_FULL_34_55]OGF36337.1 MAG: hypothetical protein A2466_06885 [Candidatus Falkowbacteria bacterium RIFOXYC2_FULL_34_220]OGF38805.1 MAG: hypothetical protein A2515_03535 [Candidatus Falkowbacteria bacterium RIFOXYD12_FULL_34_57]OGF40720.1 MAG: hypothetical protein A2531_01115 [Candidatus Falkowbacteria bact